MTDPKTELVRVDRLCDLLDMFDETREALRSCLAWLPDGPTTAKARETLKRADKLAAKDAN